MKTPTLKKARTFESITTIEDTVQRSVAEIQQRLNTFLMDKPKDIKRSAQSGLVKYERFLDNLLSRAIPAKGHAYRPSRLEVDLIADLEREEGY